MAIKSDQPSSSGSAEGVTEVSLAKPGVMAPFFYKALRDTRNGRIKWEVVRNQSSEGQDASGHSRPVLSDVAVARDPDFIRPDGSGQHYTYRFWLSKEAGKGMLIKGEYQEVREGHWITMEQMGDLAHQTLKTAIEKSLG